MTDTLSPEEIAWIAGFLEGEGWFSVRPDTGKRRVGANQVNREPLDRLRKLLGGSISQRTQINGRKGNQWPNRRPWFGWETQNQQTIALLTEAIRPWLSAERLARIPWA